MQRRLDALIEERAPWLWSPGVLPALAKPVLDRMLSYQRTLRLAETLKDQPGDRILPALARMIARRVRVSGFDRIPTSGPALIVANHPTGIADGLVLTRVLMRRRSDSFIYANADVLRVLPQLAEVIIPVEWRHERRSHAKTRATMALTKAAVDAGRLGVIFPSGRLAKRRGLRLHERPWMASAAMLARKFDLPVIPVHVDARNSALFYAFDAIHPQLRDITLFHETLNKARQPFDVRIGHPIPASALPAQSGDAIAALRAATLALGEFRDQGQPLLSPVSAGARGLMSWTKVWHG
ncbi:MAG: 1-acyl-sn-glycerol-3-phosphate acyltransferase [Pseudomonadota bacterium]